MTMHSIQDLKALPTIVSSADSRLTSIADTDIEPKAMISAENAPVR